ncbi:MAG: MFS transporter [Actinomycetes bacterium]
MPRSSSREREPLPQGFGTIWTTVAIDLIGFGIVLPILPLYAKQFGASPLTIGLIVASFSLAQMACAPLWGRLSDRIGRKPVLILSLFGTAVGSLFTGLAGAIPLLFLGRMIDGASGASVSVAQASVADIAQPRDRARLMGLLGAAFGVGFVAGPAIGAIGALWGARVPFFIAALISAANAVVAIWRLPETAPPMGIPSATSTEKSLAGEAQFEAEMERAGTLDGPQPELILDRSDGDAAVGNERSHNRAAIMRLITVSFVGMIAFSGFEATFALLTSDRFGLKLSGTGAVFTAIGLALVVVQVSLIGPVNDRVGEATTLRIGLGCNAVGLVLLAVSFNWVTLVPALALLVFGQGLITPTLSSAVAGRAGPQRGQWLGWQQSAGGLARVIGPIMAGALYERVRPGAPYVVGALVVALAIALLPQAMPTETDALVSG